MIGVFSYTVLLTYLNLVISIVGLILGFNGNALAATICLLLCALCDTFDGRIAKTKKNRTNFEKNFGVQIDSLSDMIAFGILPIVVGLSINLSDIWYIPVYVIFALAGLIRLSYFNTLVSQDKKNTDYIGLPITTSSLICPILFMMKRLSIIKYLYPLCLLIIAFLYVSKIKIAKPNKKVLFVFLIIGLIEFALLFIIK